MYLLIYHFTRMSGLHLYSLSNLEKKKTTNGVFDLQVFHLTPIAFCSQQTNLNLTSLRLMESRLQQDYTYLFSRTFF